MVENKVAFFIQTRCTTNDHNTLPVEQAVDLGVSVEREMKLSLHIANI